MGAPEWDEVYGEDARVPGSTLDEDDAVFGEDGRTEDSTRHDDDAARDEALASCYRHLGRRDHSVAELRARLERARLRPQAIEEALAIVIDQGYLDDARYARLLVEDRRAIDGWGAQRIRARLEAAGIAAELIEEALGGLDAESELAAAIALIRKRCELPLAGDRERQRAFAILIQRGFASEIAYDAVRSGVSSPAP
jgi:regulatory protein